MSSYFLPHHQRLNNSPMPDSQFIPIRDATVQKTANGDADRRTNVLTRRDARSGLRLSRRAQAGRRGGSGRQSADPCADWRNGGRLSRIESTRSARCKHSQATETRDLSRRERCRSWLLNNWRHIPSEIAVQAGASCFGPLQLCPSVHKARPEQRWNLCAGKVSRPSAIRRRCLGTYASLRR
jgi:hypothetical protein